MKARVITVVVRMPEDEAGKAVVNGAIKALEPYQTGMSMEDEMTILELIEDHDDFDPSIAKEARAKAQEMQDAACAGTTH